MILYIRIYNFNYLILDKRKGVEAVDFFISSKYCCNMNDQEVEEYHYYF